MKILDKIVSVFIIILGVIFYTPALQAQSVNKPIEFIKNQGQWEAPFLYKGAAAQADFYLDKTGFTFLLSDKDNGEKVHSVKHGENKGEVTLKYHAYKIKFINANENPTVTDAKPLSHYYNYYYGKDQSKWQTGIHPTLNVDYKTVYPGIDLHIYSQASNLKYDWVVRAGADVNNIQLQYTGADDLKIVNKSLQIKTSLGDNYEMPPIAYQYINGEKVEVACNYQLKNNIVTYKLGNNYNNKFDLIIDPVVVFCTFTGSTADNWGYTATYDSLGNFYAGGIVGYPTGSTFTGAYPATTGAIQTTFGGGGPGGMGNLFRYDASISKFSSNGSTLLYATYLGGADNDQPQSLIVDYAGNLCIAGRTYSSDFPVTTTAYDATFNGNGDLFVCKFNWNGTALIGSTFVGGSGDDGVNLYADELTIGNLKHNYGDDARSEIIMDSFNNVYIAASSSSTDFPTVSANQPTLGGLQDGVIFKLNNNCSSLLWSTYVGGSGNDAAYVLSLNKKNHSQLFVAGGTESSNFTTTLGAYQTVYQGSIDGWVRKYNANTYALQNSTFIGTSAYDQVYGVQTDDSSNVFIMGQSQGAYPVTAGVYSNPNSAQFGSKLSNSLNAMLVSTRWGKGSTTSTDVSPNAFLVDICGNIYISGWGGPIIPGNPGNTTNLPITPNATQSTTDGSDFYFIVFDANYTGLLYASFFGQNGGQGEHVDGGTSRFDPTGKIYQAICARCNNAGTAASVIFPTTPGVYSPTNLSTNCNLGAVKIDFQIIGANAAAAGSPSLSGCAPLTVNFSNGSTNATGYYWNFGDGSSDTVTTPTHVFTSGGIFNTMLVAFNPNGCNGVSDTTYLTIIVKDDSIVNNFTITKVDTCNPFSITLNNTSQMINGSFGPSSTFNWDFGDGSFFIGQNPPQKFYSTSGTYIVTLTITDTNACNNPVVLSKVVNFNPIFVSTDFALQDSACPPFTNSFTTTTTNGINYFWNFGDGGTATGASPTYTFNTPGTYTVTLIVGNPNSCNKFDTATQVIHIKPSITALFNYVQTDTCSPYVLTINNTSVLNPVYPNAASWTTYLWNFGDGNTSTVANPFTHTYFSPGTYTITLTIYDSTACNSPQTFSVPVSFADNNVTAVFGLPDSGCAPLTWTFINNSTNATNYLWNFGGGNTSTSPSPTYTFATVGTYSVTMYAYNPNSCNKVDSATQVITVYPSPFADFYYLPNPPLPNKPVSFTNTSIDAVSYIWDFGDGSFSTELNPTHLYNKSAALNVCLVAFNEYGCPDTACRPIRPEVVNIVDVPTGFSPNGDGNNDYVQVKGFGIKEMDFRIFNRWGELVYQSKDINGRWDGKYKGTEHEQDAFAYTLFVTFTDDSYVSKKGNITLIR
jgi:gliding motility-associated-like protein